MGLCYKLRSSEIKIWVVPSSIFLDLACGLASGWFFAQLLCVCWVCLSNPALQTCTERVCLPFEEVGRQIVYLVPNKCSLRKIHRLLQYFFGSSNIG